MRYVQIVVGLAGIGGGLLFAQGSTGDDRLIAATFIICGVVALATGLATYEIVNTLQRRSDAGHPRGGP